MAQGLCYGSRLMLWLKAVHGSMLFMAQGCLWLKAVYGSRLLVAHGAPVLRILSMACATPSWVLAAVTVVAAALTASLA